MTPIDWEGIEEKARKGDALGIAYVRLMVREVLAMCAERRASEREYGRLADKEFNERQRANKLEAERRALMERLEAAERVCDQVAQDATEFYKPSTMQALADWEARRG